MGLKEYDESRKGQYNMEEDFQVKELIDSMKELESYMHQLYITMEGLVKKINWIVKY